jgi:hypothetical protein
MFASLTISMMIFREIGTQVSVLQHFGIHKTALQSTDYFSGIYLQLSVNKFYCGQSEPLDPSIHLELCSSYIYTLIK